MDETGRAGEGSPLSGSPELSEPPGRGASPGERSRLFSLPGSRDRSHGCGLSMKILIVDDEQNILKTTAFALRSMGHTPFTAATTSQADRFLGEAKIDAILLDISLGNENGLEYMAALRERDVDLPIIVFTAHSSIESAVESMRQGAWDYVQKPFVPEEIEQRLIKLEKELSLQTRVRDLESRIGHEAPLVILESGDVRMRGAFEMAFRAAPSEATILLEGPSGTGKTILARAIHDRSDRAGRPFVTVNCPSLSRALLESELFGHVKGSFTGAVRDTWGKVAVADGGTLFLDEIGELPPEIQPKLLRLLQDRQYERIGETRTHQADIRLIAATNTDLEAAVGEGRFREDLYYRLKVIAIEMPSLAERPADQMALAENYLQFFSRANRKGDLRFSEETADALRTYGWPGNLRELRNVIERAVILSTGDVISTKDLPREFHDSERASLQVGQFVSLAELEQAHIRQILAASGSLEHAARILGIDSATLYRKRKKFGLR